MRWILSFAIIAVIVFALASVSANGACATVQTTFVAGTITDGGVPVEGANVEVTCNGHTKSTTSNASGGYVVHYRNPDCKYGNSVIVSATKDSLIGSNNTAKWSSGDTTIGCLELKVDVACADVPLIPEFGIVIGTLTVLSAIGVFFLVRKN